MAFTNDLITHTREVVLAAVGDRLASPSAMYPSHVIPIVERDKGLPARPYILYDMPDLDFDRIRGGLIANATMYIRVYTDADDGGELLGELLDDITIALISNRVPRNLDFAGYNIIDRTPAPSTTTDIIGGRLELETVTIYQSIR